MVVGSKPCSRRDEARHDRDQLPTLSPRKMSASSAPLAGIKAVLLDLSGTLHVGSSATPGAVAALARLRRAGIPLRLWCVQLAFPSPLTSKH
jgi:hypothetical protein